MIHDFQPNWAYNPSKTILEFLSIKDIDQCHLSDSFAKKLNKQELSIDSDVAVYLVELLGGSEDFWLNIQFNYEKNIRRLQNSDVDDNFDSYQKLIKEMKKKSWLPSSEYKYLDQLNLKSFFGLPDFSPMNEENIYTNSLGTKYKKIGSYEFSTLNLAAFMRKAELEVKIKNIKSDFNKSLFLEKLQEIKVLSKRKGLRNFEQELSEICAECGVAIVFLSALEKCPIRGVSKFVDNKGMIVITDKYNKDHIFWQTFFHEAAHLILHQDEMTHYDFGEPNDYEEDSKCEKEADNFMISQLLYPFSFDEVKHKIDFKLVYKSKRSSWKNLCTVANELNISTSVLVGVFKFSKDIEYRFFNNGHKPIFD